MTLTPFLIEFVGCVGMRQVITPDDELAGLLAAAQLVDDSRRHYPTPREPSWHDHMLAYRQRDEVVRHFMLGALAACGIYAPHAASREGQHVRALCARMSMAEWRFDRESNDPSRMSASSARLNLTLWYAGSVAMRGLATAITGWDPNRPHGVQTSIRDFTEAFFGNGEGVAVASARLYAALFCDLVEACPEVAPHIAEALRSASSVRPDPE